MNLFGCPAARTDSSVGTSSLTTPLGTIQFSVVLGDEQVSDSPVSHSFLLANEGRLWHWQQKTFELEMLRCRPVLALPEGEGMHVDDCWATVWRLQAHGGVPAGRFVSEWQPGFGWYAGGADSGQGLEAQTWNDGVVTVTMGTESGDWLADRAHRGDWLPQRLETYYGSVFDNRVEPFYRSDRGLAVPVPALTQGERCQIQFVVAWSRPGPDDAWTWYAVQRRPDQILNGAGCT